MEDLQKLLGLIRSEDAELRRFALSSMEWLPSGHEDDELLETVRQATADQVPMVRHQAGRTLTALLARRFSPPRPARPEAAGKPLTEHDGVPIQQLIEVGQRVLAPLIARLAAFVQGREHDLARRALIALGRVGAPAGINAMRQAALDPVLTEPAIVGLSRMAHPDAEYVMLEAGRSEVVRVRAAALLQLGRVKRDEAIELVHANVTHPDPLIRSNVAAALGDVRDEPALKALTALVVDDVPWVALDAVRALSFFTSPEAVLAVCQAYRSRTEQEFQASAVASLGFMKSLHGVEVLAEALAHQNARIRANAVESLTKLPLPPAELARLLDPMVADPNNRVRGNLAVAMIRWSPEKSLALLNEMFQSQDVWTRSSAAWALGRIRRWDWQDRLVAILTREQEFPVLSQALKSLDANPNQTMLGSLFPLLDHPFSAIRARAAHLLGLPRDPNIAITLCKKMQGEPDPIVRAALATSIGAAGGHAELGFLTELLLRDPDPRVKASAVEALGARRGLMQVPQLFAHLASTDHRLKANVAVALFSMGGFDVVESLLGMLDPAQPRQFGAACYAIGELGAKVRSLANADTSVHLLAALKNYSAGASAPAATAESAEPAPGWVTVELVIEKIVTALVTTAPENARGIAQKALGESGSAFVPFILHRARAAPPDAPPYDVALTEVADQVPDYVEPIIDLIGVFTDRRDTRTMLECYILAYERQLALVSEQLHIVRSLAQEGKVDAAMTPLAELTAWVPIAAGGHRRLGRSLLAQGEKERAFHHLFLAHLSSFWDPETTYEYATAAVQTRQVDLAKELCGQIMRLAPPGHDVVQRARKLLADLEKR